MNNPEHDIEKPEPEDCPNECREGVVLFYCDGEITPERCECCLGEGFIRNEG